MSTDSLPDRIIAIGASAGGLQSLENFFDHVSPSTGHAFLIVQHLGADAKSYMPELLSRRVQMPVQEAYDGLRLQRNSVVTIPPGTDLRVEQFQIRLTAAPGFHLPVDALLGSLAQYHADISTAIILSGTGSDGSKGVTALSKAGGRILAESPATAQFDGMPKSAIGTGCVDQVAESSQLPDLLEGVLDDVSGEASLYRDVFQLLLEKHDLDFSKYRQRTIRSRLTRRCSLAGCDSLTDYVRHLHADNSELDRLLSDLLIGVTSFFRDREAFVALSKVLEQSIVDWNRDREYRVWVAGCSSGEEAYSIAIMLDQLFGDKQNRPRVKVFATDVNISSVDRAAKGVYSAAELSGLDEKEKDDFFIQQDDGSFLISPDIRRNLIFSNHDFLTHAPFTNIDLVVCRNALIYMQNELQEKALRSFNFSLVENGVLFLGLSESLGNLKPYFEEVHQRFRVFRKIHAVSAPIDRSLLGRGLPRVPRMNNRSESRRGEMLNSYFRVVADKCELGLLLDEEGHLAGTVGDMGRIFGRRNISETEAGLGELEEEVEARIRDAMSVTRKAEVPCVILENVCPTGIEDPPYRVGVWPVHTAYSELCGWFLDFRETHEGSEQTPSSNQRLAAELEFTKVSLNATVEQLGASNEELQAANEEMLASNEELQSTNEELQSLNEELHTVNEQYHSKIEELREMSLDMENLLAESEIGTVFLDSDLRIQRFTTAIKRHIDLLELDVGRNLENFRHRLGFAELYTCLRQVVSSGEAFAAHVLDEYGEPILLKLVPYTDRRPDEERESRGVILNVIHRAFSGAKEQVVVVNEMIGAWEWPDTSKDRMWWSPNCYRLLGYLASDFDATFERWKDLIHEDDVGKLDVVGTSRCEFAATGKIQLSMRHRDGNYITLVYQGIVELSEDGKVVSMSGTASKSNPVPQFRRENEVSHETEGS